MKPHSNPSIILSCNMFSFCSALSPDVLMASVFPRVSLTVASVMKAIRVSSVTDDRSLQRAGGFAVGVGSVGWQKGESRSVTVSRGSPGLLATQVTLKDYKKKKRKFAENESILCFKICSFFLTPPTCRNHMSRRNGKRTAEAPPTLKNVHVHQQDSPHGLFQILPGVTWRLL